MRISPHHLFDACYGQYAVAAVNVFTLEQVHALFHAANKAQSPIIVQLTPVARSYTHPAYFAGLIQGAAQVFPNVVYAVHVDHGNEDHCNDAVLSGNYDSVMIDASHDPLEENIRRTLSVVEVAKPKRVFVEAELGVLSGKEDDLDVDEAHALYTDPDEAVYFVERTQCNSLAIAVGTSHGAYKFSGGKGIQFDILEELNQKLPRFPLVLHGGSGVNKKEVEMINAVGGTLAANAKGVDDEELREAIKLGICKVNIATDTRLLWTRVHREFFHHTPDQIDLVVPGKKYMEEYVPLMLEKFELLGSKGKASNFH